ncbi:spartin-like isoform X2 [Lethenteron reissneri]|uniref:spartin-like isoform X2 n=1 Tax=Lethenteron reissneri TaxID=7753 RepID=UPI002AB78EE2|nr:spartin-like isoform X2 [Lethenteron reissneri]
MAAPKKTKISKEEEELGAAGNGETAAQLISAALGADEVGDLARAFVLYRDALKRVDEELLESASQCGEERHQLELVAMQEMVAARLAVLGADGATGMTPSSVSAHCCKPSLKFDVDGPCNGTSDVVDAAADDDDDDISEDDGGDADDLEVLMELHDGARLFFVASDSSVSSLPHHGPLQPSCGLRILTSSERDPAQPAAYLQVCTWVYPLVPGVSPVLCCAGGVYIFPMEANAPSPAASLPTLAAVPLVPPGTVYAGLVLSADLADHYKDLLHDLLLQLSLFKDERWREPPCDLTQLSNTVPVRPPSSRPPGYPGDPAKGYKASPVVPEWSEKIANGINTGAGWVSWGLESGASLAGRAVAWGGAEVRSRLQAADAAGREGEAGGPPVATAVDPRVQEAMRVSRSVAGGALTVSRFMVDGVSWAAGRLGRGLAPHVRACGERILPESLTRAQPGEGSTLDGALVVAASGVQGFATVWQGMESAAHTIASSVSNATVQTVQHRYGAEAGETTESALQAALSAGVCVYNLSHLGVKGLVKRTAKETGRAVLHDYTRPPKPRRKR